MSLTYLGKNGRVYRRRFDHEDALRRREAGETFASLARRYGVSKNAVRYAVSPTAKAELLRAHAALRARGRCERCGGWKHGATKATLCRACAMDDLATTVGDGGLRCVTCQEWKPDEDFPWNRPGKLRHRGRHSQCRVCLTAAKRDYRHRNSEAQRAYDREYKRRRRNRAGVRA